MVGVAIAETAPIVVCKNSRRSINMMKRTWDDHVCRRPSFLLQVFPVADNLIVLHDLRQFKQQIFFRRHEDGPFFWAYAPPLELGSVMLGIEPFVGFLVVPGSAEDLQSEEKRQNRRSPPDVGQPVLSKPLHP